MLNKTWKLRKNKNWIKYNSFDHNISEIFLSFMNKYKRFIKTNLYLFEFPKQQCKNTMASKNSKWLKIQIIFN